MTESVSLSTTRNRLTIATACAVMMATTCVVAGVEQQVQMQQAAETRLIEEVEESEVIRRIDAYCRASWKNSRIDESLWDDCSQDVFARVLGSLTREQLQIAITQKESPERRELNRAIWAIAQRRRRDVRWQELTEHNDAIKAPVDAWATMQSELRTVVAAAESGNVKLSPTQRVIIRSSSEGQSVNEIAQRLNLSPVRVSDEKYKATQKLRKHFSVG